MFEKEKYKKELDKIKATDDFKYNLIRKMKSTKVKDNKFTKLQKVLTASVAILTILCGSGFAYAKAGGTFRFPDFSLFGVKFSSEYNKYKNECYQVVEDEGIKIALENYVCDEGFCTLEFRVNLNDEMYFVDEEYKAPLCFVSFNEKIQENEEGYKVLNLGGANYNLIINDEEHWLRGKSFNSLQEISYDEYIFYQTWFIDDNYIDNKDEYTLKLKDIAIGFGEDFIAVNGEFNINVSKKQALENTKETSVDEELIYNKLSMTMKKIIQTPMINIIRLEELQENLTLDEMTYVKDENYIRELEFFAMDQNGNYLTINELIGNAKLIYEDGTIQESSEDGELDVFEKEFDNVTKSSTKYLTIENNEEITNLSIILVAKNDYYESYTPIGIFEIDLNDMTVKINRNVNVEISNIFEEDQDDELDEIDIDDMVVATDYEIIYEEDDDYSIMNIYGCNEEGRHVWTYTTNRCKMTEYSMVEFLGGREEIVIINDCGTIVSLNRLDGSLNWKNTSYKTGGTRYLYTDDYIFLAGGETPNLLILDYAGNTIKQLTGFDKFSFINGLLLNDNDDIITIEFQNQDEYSDTIYIAQLNWKTNEYTVNGYYEYLDDNGNYELKEISPVTYTAKEK